MSSRGLFLLFGVLAWEAQGWAQASSALVPNEDPNKPEGYQFDPNQVQRDPFEPPFFDKSKENEEDEIIRADIREIKLVAIMKGQGASKVMVKVNGNFHVLQVGDVMGKARDTIFKIDDESITMEKLLKDFKGNKKSQLYKIELDPKK